VFFVKQIGGETNFIYSYCSLRNRVDVQCPRFHIGPHLGSVSAGLFRIADNSKQAASEDPSSWGSLADKNWSEWIGLSTGWREGQVNLV
jgi:hypothetical protein